MAENQVLDDNGVVSGGDSQNVLLGQGASVTISAPTAAGQVIEQRVQNGQQVVLDFDAASATPSIEGSNFVLSFDGNGDGVADSKIVFLEMVAQAQSGDAPILIINGNEVSADQLIGQALALLNGDTLETAAGPTNSNPQSGGGSVYSEDTGEGLTLLSVLGALATGTDLEAIGLLQGQEDLDPVQAVAEVVPEVVDTNNDLILTNIMQGDIKIPEWALLHNDTAADKDKLSVEGVSNPVNGTVDHDADADKVTFAINGESKVVDQPSSTPDSASFDYAAGDGDTNDNSTAGISFENNQRLTGTLASEIIIGNNGSNELVGDFTAANHVTGINKVGAGDAIIGNKDDDTLIGDFAIYRNGEEPSDLIQSSFTGGDDRIQAGRGNDKLVGDLFIDGDVLNSTVTGGKDDLRGGRGDDVLIGDFDIDLDVDQKAILTGGDDTLRGGAGNDTLIGDGLVGDDVEDGSTLNGGNDDLRGGSGNDTLIGDYDVGYRIDEGSKLTGGDDILRGGAGNDTLIGDARFEDDVEDNSILTGGNDDLRGGSENDTLIGDFHVGYWIDDGAKVTGGDDILRGGAGDDTLIGDIDNDEDIEDGSTAIGGNDTLRGGAGNDTLIGDVRIKEEDREGWENNLENNAVLTGGNDDLHGGRGEDSLLGDFDIADSIFNGSTATGGDDTLNGGVGNDTLIGDAKIGDNVDGSILTGGSDTLVGGKGDDTLTGDFVIGGSIVNGSTVTGGDDTFVFSLDGGEGGDGNDTITDFESDKDILHFTDVTDSNGDGQLNFDDLLTKITSVNDGGEVGNPGDVVVNFTNGASITFQGVGNGTITSIDELVNDSANQIVID